MCPEASRPLTIVFVPWNLMPRGEKTKRARTLPEAEETTETRRAWLVPWTEMRVLPTLTVTVSGPSGAERELPGWPERPAERAVLPRARSEPR